MAGSLMVEAFKEEDAMKTLKKICVGMWLMLSMVSGAATDFEGLLHGQTVLIHEERAEPFENRTFTNSVGLPTEGYPLSTGDGKASDSIRWSFGGGPYYLDQNNNQMINNMIFEGIAPDASGRNLPKAPMWTARWGWVNSMMASIVLLPNAQIPDGKWIISVEALFGIDPYVSPFGQEPGPRASEADLMLICSLPQAVSNPTLSQTAHKSFLIGSEAWQAASVTVTVNEDLTSCRDAGGDIYLQWTLDRFEKVQFNGFRVSMAKLP